MRQLGRAMALMAVLAVSAGLAHAAATPAQKCAAAKMKAVSKKLSAKLKCIQTSITKGVAVDPACITKAETKFSAAIAKAESKGGCSLTGDGATLEALVDSQANAVAAFTPVKRFSCCDDAVGDCWYETNPNAVPCGGFFLGDPNSVCDGATGTCILGTAQPGFSCNNTTGYLVNPPCNGGPENTPTTCITSGLGQFDPNSICPPNGGNSVGF